MTVHLLTGEDESILRSKVHDLVKHLVGAGTRSLMVDEFSGDEYEIRALVDAARTMPFLSDKRIVVGRNIAKFTADELTPLIELLASPLESTDLVLVGGGGRIPKRLTDAVAACGGHTENTNPPTRTKDRATWVQTQAAESGIRLDPQAASRIAEQLGDDVSRLDGILGVLVSTYGANTRVSIQHVEPFLGEAGGVPPWDFTDAIDAGETTKALTLMGRMMNGGERHPLVIMSILHGHYAKIARLDGIDARDEQDVATALGIKPGFPAKKALGNYRRLGGTGIGRALQLIAKADLDLRGATDLEPELVMELLVARLSRLAPKSTRSR